MENHNYISILFSIAAIGFSLYAIKEARKNKSDNKQINNTLDKYDLKPKK